MPTFERPTHERLPRFDADWNKLTKEQQDEFKVAVAKFVDDLQHGQGFRAGLRVKLVRGTGAVWELTWAKDGRATWQYGQELKTGEPHVIWRRIGSHEIFGGP
jgi:hypothetical protein